jgi:HK97 family phage portal protein
MNIFTRIGSWMQDGLRRLAGIQYGIPSSYREEAASPVTFDSAMQLSAVWACVKLIAETVSSLPLTVYRKTDTGRKEAVNHPLTLLFSGKVNRYQTKVEFFETVLLNLLTTGNAYCYIQRIGDRIVGLLPLMSADMETTLLLDGSLVYSHTTDTGMTAYSEKSIWHLKLMGNGVIGLSPLAYQRNTLGIAQAAEDAVTKIYRNGAKPSGVLSMDKFLTQEQRDLVRQKFYTLSAGNEDRLMVLEGGMKFDAISLSPQDIELLASRQFQISEICRWYGVPSVMINDTSSSTVWGSGIEQIVSGFYKLTLRPLMEKIEASILVNLMGPTEGAKYEVEFDFNALTRSDLKTRFDSYRVGIYGGFLKPNEARRMEGMPDADGGDNLYMQGANMKITDIEINNPMGDANGNQTDSTTAN